MRRIIGETHFYCGFCNKLFSKKELNILTGRHMNYELAMIKAGRDLQREIKKILKQSNQQFTP